MEGGVVTRVIVNDQSLRTVEVVIDVDVGGECAIQKIAVRIGERRP